MLVKLVKLVKLVRLAKQQEEWAKNLLSEFHREDTWI